MLLQQQSEAVDDRRPSPATTAANSRAATSMPGPTRRYPDRFIRPGKPVENAFIESFNARREECLSQSWFQSLADAQAASAAWMQDYNDSRPHSSLGGLAPAEYAAKLLLGPGFEEVA